MFYDLNVSLGKDVDSSKLEAIVNRLKELKFDRVCVSTESLGKIPKTRKDGRDGDPEAERGEKIKRKMFG